MTRGSWERDDIADVGHSGNKQYCAFEAQSKAGVWDSAIAAEVSVPPIVIGVEVTFLHALDEHIQTFFALAAADDFSDTWNEHIHGADGFSVVVAAHVEWLESTWVVIEDHWSTEVLFGEESFVFGLQVAAPLDRVIKAAAALVDDINGFCVGESDEGFSENIFEPGEDSGIDTLVEEFHIIAAICEYIADDGADEGFGQIHIVIEVVERHFGFDHPEFSEVAGGVAVFGAEGRAEGVDITDGSRIGFCFQLATYGERCRFTEKVLFPVDAVDLFFGEHGEVERGDLKHFAGAFAVGCSDDGGIEIQEAAVLKEGMNGPADAVADASDCAEGIGAWAEVGDVAEEFEGVTFFLQRVGLWVGRTENFDGSGMKFDSLAFAGGFAEKPMDGKACSGGNVSNLFFKPCDAVFGDDLQVLHAAAVVEFDEGK